jgi:hypothetical protein
MNFLKKLSLYNKIFLLLLTIVTLNYFFFNYRIILRQNAYIAADWLINYQGGFVRRGLIGEIIYTISKNINISILNIVFFISSSAFFLFIFIFYKCVKNFLKFNYFYLYLFLPSTLLFTFFDPLAVGRKESLVLLFISLYTYFLINKQNDNIIFQVILSILLIFVTLTHEIMFFYLPYIFAIKLMYKNTIRINFFFLKNLYFEFILFFISLTCIILILLFSHLHDNNLLCESLLNLNLNKSICGGVITEYKGKQTYFLILEYILAKNYLSTYGLIIFLNFLPIIFYFFLQKKNKENNSLRLLYLTLSLICFLFTLPIFLIVNDWGRYLNIHFINHALLFMFILKNNQNYYKQNLKNTPIIKKLSIIIIICFYLGSWFMPHCCRTEIGDGYKSIYNRIYFRLNDESNETNKYGTDYPRLLLKKVLNLN